MADISTYTPPDCPYHGKPLDHLVVYTPPPSDTLSTALGATRHTLTACVDCPIVGVPSEHTEVRRASPGTDPWDLDQPR